MHLRAHSLGHHSTFNVDQIYCITNCSSNYTRSSSRTVEKSSYHRRAGGSRSMIRNKSLQEETECMRLGSCGLCPQLPEALQQLVWGFSIFGARSSVALGSGGSPVHCKVCSSTPDLHQLDASSPAQEWQPKLSPDIANVPMGKGAKSSQVENQWSRQHSCNSLTTLSAKLRFFSFSNWPTFVHFQDSA